MAHDTSKRDIAKDGMMGGLLGSLGDSIIHSLGFFILGTTTTYHYISQMIFPYQEITMVRFLFSFFTHLYSGAFVGIILAIIYRLIGYDYAYLKGMGLGLAFWIIHVIVIPNVVPARPYLFRTEVEAFVDFIAHIVYGGVTAYYLRRVMD